jgi:hypothetical protein
VGRKLLSISVLLWRHPDPIQSMLPILPRLGREKVPECCYRGGLVTAERGEKLVRGLPDATVLCLRRVSVRNVVRLVKLYTYQLMLRA